MTATVAPTPGPPVIPPARRRSRARWWWIALPVALVGFVFLWAGILGVHVLAIVRALNGYRLFIPGVSVYASRF